MYVIIYLIMKLLRMNYSSLGGVNTIGLGKLERDQYSALLRETHVTITVKEAASILGLANNKASMLLSLLAKKGWLKRIYYGVYLPVPLESPTSNIVAEEPFVIAEKLFSPCYIGGVNAVSHWDLTEQMFRTITVMSQKPVRKRHETIAGCEYYIHTTQACYFFGLKSVWLNDVKIHISDPTRTIIDLLMFPESCGGIRFIVDVIQAYYRSQHKDFDLMIAYLEQAKNGAVIKRLGFLIEKFFPDEEKLIQFCLMNLTKGYAKLSTAMDCDKLVSRWSLWVPSGWKEICHDS